MSVLAKVKGYLTEEEYESLLKELNKPYFIRFLIGDETGIGHGKSEYFYIESNKSLEEIQQAYIQSCNTLGIQLHQITYLAEGVLPIKEDLKVLVPEEHSFIDFEDMKFLQEKGYVLPEENERTYELYEDGYIYREEGFIHLLLWFIDYSLDNWSYNIKTIESFTTDGQFEKNKEIFMGYGIFPERY